MIAKVTVTRTLVYYGDKEHIEKTLSNSIGGSNAAQGWSIPGITIEETSRSVEYSEVLEEDCPVYAPPRWYQK